MAIKRNITSVRLRDLESPDVHSIWVLNNAMSIHRKPTQVVMPVMLKDGTSVSISIPATWIPIELTEQVSKQALLDSELLRRNLADRLLVLISEDDAELILAEPDAQLEKSRLEELRLRSLRGEVLDASGTDTPRVVAIDSNGRPVFETPKSNQTVDLASKAHPILVDAFEGGHSVSECANAIRRIRGIMTADDMAYVKSKTSDASIIRLLS